MLLSQSQCAKALTDLFCDQEQSAAHLLQLLEDEREAIGNGDLTTMDTTAISKSAILAELEQLKASEQRLLANLPFSGSATPLEQALTWCDEDGTLRAAYKAIVDLMITCDRNNRHNGLLLQHRLNYVRRALNVLHNAHTEMLAYKPDGSHSYAGTSRLLAEG